LKGPPDRIIANNPPPTSTLIAQNIDI
jgi:hypothetical protein